MRPKEFIDTLAKLKLQTDGEAATVLGISRRSVIRYKQGDQDVPVIVQRMLRLLQQHGIPKEFAR